MKIPVRKIMAANAALESLLDTQDFEIGVVLANCKARLEPTVEYYTKAINKIAKEYGEKDEDGKPIITEGIIKAAPGREYEFLSESSKLSTAEVDVYPKKCSPPEGITGRQIYDLLGIVNFAGGDNENEDSKD